jgi:putative flippase GtrA
MTADGPEDDATQTHGLVRHVGGFVASGAMAFTTDAAILALLTKGLGTDPFLARLVAIAVAIIAGWLSHRRLTFAVSQRPSFGEFLSFAAVAWTSAAINYAVYAAVLLRRPETEPLVAMVVASLVAMIASYAGMRLGVFGKPGTR